VIRRSINHNELFPSGDWRYLLPDPSPLAVVTIGHGPTASSAKTLWPAAKRVEAETMIGSYAHPGSADLVVADDFNSSTLDLIRRLLVPGGVAYAEIDWPRPSPPTRLTRQIERTGLGVDQLYSVSPSRERWSPSWWIPVGHREATTFVATEIKPTNPNSGPPLNRLRALLISWLLRSGPRFRHHPWLLHPTRRQRLGAVIRRPDSSTTDSAHAGDRKLAPAELQSRPDLQTLLRIGGSSTDQAILFFFVDRLTPVAVIKAPTIPEEIRSSRHEARILSHLSNRSDSVAAAPMSVPVRGAIDFAAWGQTFAPGVAMTNCVSPSNLEEHARTITAALVDLALNTVGAVDEAPQSAVVDDMCRELGRSLDAVADGTKLVAGVESSLKGLLIRQTVCQHHDVGPWNIRVTRSGRPTIIDWADAVEAGFPMCDLFHFLVHLCFCAHDGYRPSRRSALIAEIMDPGSDLGALVASCLADYGRQIDLAMESIPQLRVLTWVIDLLRRPRSQRAEGLYLELLRAELRWATSAP